MEQEAECPAERNANDKKSKRTNGKNGNGVIDIKRKRFSLQVIR